VRKDWSPEPWEQSPAARTAYGHFVKGFVLHAQNRWQEAVPEFETALALDRNMVGALHELGACKIFTGSIDEVIPLVEQAIRLSPRDPNIDLRYFLIGTVHLLQSRVEAAIVWLEKARTANPVHPLTRAWLACRTRRSQETGRRFFKYRQPEGPPMAVLGAEDPRLV